MISKIELAFKIYGPIVICQDGEEVDNDEDWTLCKDSDSDADEDFGYEEENLKKLLTKLSPAQELAAV